MLIRMCGRERHDARWALLHTSAKLAGKEPDTAARMMMLWSRLNGPMISERIELDACERGDLREALHAFQEVADAERVARLRDLFRKLTYVEQQVLHPDDADLLTAVAALEDEHAKPARVA